MSGDDKKPVDARAEREAKLAAALRANLRRRKAPAAAPGPSADDPPPDKSGG